MLYVSHRLEEVFAISDRVTITRNGRDVLTRDRSALTIPEVIEGMIGQQREALFPPALAAAKRHRAHRGGGVQPERRPARRRQLHRPFGRDRRLCRPRRVGRLRPVRHAVRHAQVARRRGALSRWTGHAEKRDRGGAPQGLPRPCRSPARRADARQVDPVQHVERRRRRARDGSPWYLARAGARARPPPDRRASHQGRAVRARQLPVGRQPAEGRHRQMAGDRAAGLPARRPDARRRCRRQAGDLQPDPARCPPTAASCCSARPNCPN